MYVFKLTQLLPPCLVMYSKITDISKKISIAWKKLKPEDREKWNLIAKKDKVRVFIA